MLAYESARFLKCEKVVSTKIKMIFCYFVNSQEKRMNTNKKMEKCFHMTMNIVRK